MRFRCTGLIGLSVAECLNVLFYISFLLTSMVASV